MGIGTDWSNPSKFKIKMVELHENNHDQCIEIIKVMINNLDQHHLEESKKENL